MATENDGDLNDGGNVAAMEVGVSDRDPHDGGNVATMAVAGACSIAIQDQHGDVCGNGDASVAHGDEWGHDDSD
eukprot:11191860-Lingulodinium_polyedra.AAC.1